MCIDEGLGSDTARDDSIRGWRWIKTPAKMGLFATSNKANLPHDRIDLAKARRIIMKTARVVFSERSTA